MGRFLKRVHGDSKGFTLIELLIVIAIIGILAAVIIPNFTGLVGTGKTEAAAAELTNVQTAMDTMMARKGLTAVTATEATDDMAKFPKDNPLYPDYMRTQKTKGTYSCSTTGLVTQVTTGY